MTMGREKGIKRVFSKQIGDWCDFSDGKMGKNGFSKK